MNAAMIMIEGQQGFKVESAASTVIALRMSGFIRSYGADGSERYSKDGSPLVTIAYLNQRPIRAYQSEALGLATTYECPVLGCEEHH
jgi:hypothetical protein